MNHDEGAKGYGLVRTPGGDLHGRNDRAGAGNRSDIATVAADNLSAANDSRGDTPTTVGQPPKVQPSRSDIATTALRDRLRSALRRHIDPDDDTMPAIWPGGDFIWLGTDSVIDDLVAAVGAEQLAADRNAAQFRGVLLGSQKNLRDEQAAAAVERVRAECAAIGTPHICNAVDRILGVLDQPKEQP
ncbi:hypothetical protein [Streptomyces brevispora]|uniref:Uncharacterized protein n=1 Tax=Streptomyces brevispora TaxID=887462 RepID=A0ABZ1G522_9ACTN|nr:hypothetical protein [Streptomyces brevispora]WSC14927.1 hypothetical protein OIE64_20185 [Streptomyces brevispora]